MSSKTRFWNGVLVFLSAVNLGAVWFAAQPGEAWHATVHAGLALGFGLWAQRRMGLAGPGPAMPALERTGEAETAALRDEVEDVRHELGEMQERLDFTERLLTQAREGERLPRRPEG